MTDGTTGLIVELRTVFAEGHTRERGWRLEQLAGLEALLGERESEIVAALWDDLRRSRVEAWMGDVASTRAEVVYARSHLTRWLRRRKVSLPGMLQPGRAWLQSDPLGVVLIIGPWNYPFFLTLGPLVGALAAGNCVVVKPSELAPASSHLISQLISQYLDDRAVRVVEGDAHMTQRLLASGFDHAFFTGGTEVGKLIMAGAAQTLTPVTLELGGKSPVIVAADADIQVAARRIVWTKLANCGQTCIAPDYVLVESAIRDELTAALVTNMKRMSGPTNTDRTRSVVNRMHFQRLTDMITRSEGKVLVGGTWDESTLEIDPTIVMAPSESEPLMEHEIFGPVLPIVPVKSVEDAVQFALHRPKPLALYVFSRSRRVAQHVVDSIPSGGATINHIGMQCLAPSLPFGGVGPSGMGAYHGRWGFENFSHRRAVLAKPIWPDPALLYPPYSEWTLKVMRKLLR